MRASATARDEGRVERDPRGAATGPEPSPPVPAEAREACPPSVFRRLLGEAAWRRLHPEVRRRFAGEPETTLYYAGFMAEVRMSPLGWLFAQACRLIGTPLAPHRGRDVPVLARVHRDETRGGTAWERFYCYPGRAPVRVSSTKVHDAEAGLLEVVNGGLGMYLRLGERDAALTFESLGYFWQLFGRRLPLPGLLTPGRTLVTHAAEAGGSFRFTLDMRHPVFGETVHQTGLFREMN